MLKYYNLINKYIYTYNIIHFVSRKKTSRTIRKTCDRKFQSLRKDFLSNLQGRQETINEKTSIGKNIQMKMLVYKSHHIKVSKMDGGRGARTLS